MLFRFLVTTLELIYTREKHQLNVILKYSVVYSYLQMNKTINDMKIFNPCKVTMKMK